MPARRGNGVCCLCGLPYESFGHNPRPLWQRVGDRCCSACNEVVIEARITPAKIDEEIMRVEEALERTPGNHAYRQALAAICASRGPGLLAESKRAISLIKAKMEEDRTKL